MIPCSLQNVFLLSPLCCHDSTIGNISSAVRLLCVFSIGFFCSKISESENQMVDVVYKVVTYILSLLIMI